MSDQTPADQGRPAPTPDPADRSDQEPGRHAPSPPDDQTQDENQNSTGKDPHKPTLAELMLPEQQEQAKQADKPEEHKPTLAELIAVGKGIPQQDQPPKVEISLKDMVAEALAESDRAQSEQDESGQDADPHALGAPDGQDVQADPPQQAAPEPAKDLPQTPQVAAAETPQVAAAETPQVAAAETPQVAAAETPQVAAAETPPAVEQEPTPPAAGEPEPAKPSHEDREEQPAKEQVAEEAGAQPESSEPAEGKAPSDQPPAKPARAPGIVKGPCVVARYGLMRHTGQFRHNLKSLPAPGTRIVVRTHRGIEMAKVMSCICDDQHPGCITHEHLVAYVAANGRNYPLRCEGKVLRVANQQDLADCERLRSSVKQEAAFCQQCATEMKLAIKIVSVDHLIGDDRIVFYFTAERRVDFRTLVHKLSSQYHTRIEMRQVGARDEARLVADYEKCGQQCCCQAFLKDLKPVSMRMAKIQKASLDPAKISGRCGRLMCCMRFEDETYEQLRKKLPAKKTWVRTQELIGKVIDTSILSQLVSIAVPGGRTEVVANEEIIERDVKQPSPAQIHSEPRDTSPKGTSPPSRGGRARAAAPETKAKQTESSASDQNVQQRAKAPDGSSGPKKRRRRGRRSRRGGGKQADPSDGAPKNQQG